MEAKPAHPKNFFNYTSPKYALTSAGIMNKFGHPHSSVVSRLIDNDVKILRTDQSGAVLLTSDGKNIDVKDWC